ncbi:CBS domain-containing protein [Candidatus Microgenomates bacterium]|nr:MAG: CBS domain-containing protein [Candidatus Microgenomates bacterium]
MFYVKQLMRPQVLTIKPQTTLSEVWQILSKRHVHALPVVDKNKILLGIVSEEDVLETLFPGYKEMSYGFPSTEDEEEMSDKLQEMRDVRAEKFMNVRVIFTKPNTNIMRALSRMLVNRVRQLPVVNDENQVIGIISKADIVRGLLKRK